MKIKNGNKVLFLGVVNKRPVMVYVSDDGNMRASIGNDPLDMLRYARPTLASNQREIWLATRGRDAGLGVTIPAARYDSEPDYGTRQELETALLSMKPVLDEDGYMEWDFAPFIHPAFDDGENGMRRSVTFRDTNGEIREAKNWTGGCDTGWLNEGDYKYIPIEFHKMFREQIERFKAEHEARQEVDREKLIQELKAAGLME